MTNCVTGVLQQSILLILWTSWCIYVLVSIQCKARMLSRSRPFPLSYFLYYRSSDRWIYSLAWRWLRPSGVWLLILRYFESLDIKALTTGPLLRHAFTVYTRFYLWLLERILFLIYPRSHPASLELSILAQMRSVSMGSSRGLVELTCSMRESQGAPVSVAKPSMARPACRAK